MSRADYMMPLYQLAAFGELITSSFYRVRTEKLHWTPEKGEPEGGWPSIIVKGRGLKGNTLVTCEGDPRGDGFARVVIRELEDGAPELSALSKEDGCYRHTSTASVPAHWCPRTKQNDRITFPARSEAEKTRILFKTKGVGVVVFPEMNVMAILQKNPDRSIGVFATWSCLDEQGIKTLYLFIRAGLEVVLVHTSDRFCEPVSMFINADDGQFPDMSFFKHHSQ